MIFAALQNYNNRGGGYIFTQVLNVQGQFDELELMNATQRPLRPQMADMPSKSNWKDEERQG